MSRNSGNRSSVRNEETRSGTSSNGEVCSARRSLESPKKSDVFTRESPLRERLSVKLEKSGIKNYHEIMEKESIEEKLLKARFSVIGKIVLGNGDDKREYVQAYNRDGIKVLILIDQGGYSMKRNNDVKMRKGDIQIPHSIKNGIVSGMQSMATGVALLCNNGICTITAVDDPNYSENNYTNEENEEDSDFPLVYPIIKMSEINDDVDAVNFNTSLVNRDIVNNSFSILNDKMNNFIECTKTLYNSSVDSFNKINHCASILEKKIKEVSAYHYHFIQNPPVNDEEKEFFSNVEKMMRLYHDQIHTLISSMCQIAAENKKVDQMIQKINNCADFVSNHIN